MAIRWRRTEHQRLSNGCAVLFNLIFVVVGIGVFYVASYAPMKQWYLAQSWQSVPCVILESGVRSHSSKNGTPTYSVFVAYAYEVDGKPYVSSAYNFSNDSSSGREGKEFVVEQIPPGKRTVCYVDPEDPTNAVFDRTWNWFYAFGFIFLFTFVPIGLWAIFSAHRKAATPLPHRPGEVTALASPAPQMSTSPQNLQSSISPKQTLTAALVFTVLWYAILGAVGWGFLQDGFSFANIIPIVIVTVMALGGLIGVAGVVRGFLGLWNPRVRLSMEPADLRLGATAELAWELTGDASRLTSFKLYLQGRESATYRRGTDTSTDHSIFEKITIAEATAQADMRMGRVHFAMPEFTMPTLDLPNNKIQWVLRVEGSIPRWPDVEEEYPVNVLPLSPPSSPASEAPHA